jgi:hypothetical protein
MDNRAVAVSLRTTAKVAGFAMLAMAVFAFFANFFVLEDLIVSGDATATATNILGSEGRFRLGITSMLMVVILDVVAAWALYLFFKPVNTGLSLLTACFRLVFAAIFGAAVLNLILALEFVGGDAYLTALDPAQAQAQMLFFLDAFTYGWQIGLAFFALHLAGLGYLVLKSGYVPRVLGVLAIVAGLGYLIDSFAHVLLSNYDDYDTAFLLIAAVPSIIGELSLTVWLLARGGKAQPRETGVLEPTVLAPGRAPV